MGSRSGGETERFAVVPGRSGSHNSDDGGSAPVPTVIAIILTYAGLLTCLLGVVSLLKPLRWVGISTRRRGAGLFAAGVALFVVGTNLPTSETRIDAPRTQLDRFAPTYQFNEVHTLQVNASPEQVFQAIKEVHASEIRLFRTLTWIRRLGGDIPEGVLNPGDEEPLLAIVTRTGFLLLAEEPGREIVIGTAVVVPPGWHPKGEPTPEDYRTLNAPGFALGTMNFLVEGDAAGQTRVTTETRVYATDAATRRRFARYWRVIYPGSALIRRMWLRAVRLRAEASP